MDWLNMLGKYMERQQAGGTSPGHVGGDVYRDFGEVAQKAPRSTLVEGLAEAFRSNQTPPFGEMIAHLFSQASPDQRAGIAGRLLNIAPESVTGGLAAMFGKNREVKPEDTANLSPDMIRNIADEAAKKDPGIIDRISDLLADHPSLLKNLDIGSLATALGAIGMRLGGGRTMRGGGGA